VTGDNSLANVLNRRNGYRFAIGITAIGDGLAAGVDAGEVGGLSDGLGPGEEVLCLFREQATAIFLVEKENCARRKAFALRCCCCCGGVLAPEGSW
jgi:hypothetical protein